MLKKTTTIIPELGVCMCALGRNRTGPNWNQKSRIKTHADQSGSMLVKNDEPNTNLDLLEFENYKPKIREGADICLYRQPKNRAGTRPYSTSTSHVQLGSQF